MRIPFHLKSDGGISYFTFLITDGEGGLKYGSKLHKVDYNIKQTTVQKLVVCSYYLYVF